MSKKSFKSQASSSKAFSHSSSAFGTSQSFTGSAFGTASSPLSYLAEQPDLSTLSDSNLVVQFKNLAKRDSTTKARGLEELQNTLSPLEDNEIEVDENLLNAWVKIYPRTSIDGSRRVRQLAHQVHGRICLQSGKRVAKHMPSIIGAWFAGSQDGDKIVARAASEAFNLVFPTTDKRAALTKVYQSSILEFCRDAILRESPKTLSDERMTSADESEAKYFRVISSCILSLCELMGNLSREEINKQSHTYEEIFGSEHLWAFQGSKDSGVRRSIFKLLRVGLQKHQELLSPYFDLICNTLFSEKVVRKQTATALDYVMGLLELSTADPTLWTSASKPSQSRAQKFFEFVKRGSQGASDAFWKVVYAILKIIPAEALPNELERAVEALDALRTGINQKDEQRSNAEQAWICYIELSSRLAVLLPDDDKQRLMTDCCIPLFQQYFNPTAEQASWTIQGPKSNQIVVNLLQIDHMVAAAESVWPLLAESLLEAIKTSAPEQSKEFKSSQDSISIRARKWFVLQASILKGNYRESFTQAVRQTSIQLAVGCADTVRTRNGKPYGAAEALQEAISNLKPWLLEDDRFSDLMNDFISVTIPDLIFSASRSQLISILYDSQELSKFTESWNATLQAILQYDNTTEKENLLTLLLTSPKIPVSFELPLKRPELQSFLRQQAEKSISEDGNWDLFKTLFRAPVAVMSTETLDFISSELVNSLTVSAKGSNSLAGLEVLTQNGQQTANPQLRQNILLLTESEDDALAQRAISLNEQMTASTLNGTGTERSKASTIQVIQNGLSEASSSSLSVETLLELALQNVQATSESSANPSQELLPSVERWVELLEPILAKPVPQSFSTSIQLGGVISLFGNTIFEKASGHSIQFDRLGFSAPLRMCLYTIGLFEETTITNDLENKQFASIFRLLLLTVQLINDKLTLSTSNNLWSIQDAAIEDAMSDYTSRARKLFISWLRRSTEEIYDPELRSGDNPLYILQSTLWTSSTEETWLSFHHARAYSYVVSELVELHGWKSQSETFLETRLRELRQSKNNLRLMTFVSAFRAPLANTKYYIRVCNELVADLTGASLDSSSREVNNMLVLLALMLDEQDQIAESVAKQRIIFLVQHITPWLEAEDTDISMKAHICNVLKIFLPVVHDVYGSFWTSILEFLCATWNQAQAADQNIGFSPQLPIYNASLRLFSLFSLLAMDADGNDDLKDAMKESEQSAFNGMVHLLKQLNRVPDSFDQPLQIVNELLGRQIAKIPIGGVENLEELISLVAAESLPAQRCAFDLLHRQIPKQQEQISVDTVLEKRSAQIADELLSLVIEAPAIEGLSDSDFLRSMPLSIRSYLSAWLLIFDNFKGASDKVRNDYTAQLKEQNILPNLLDFTADFLGHSRGKPIDASKFDVAVYSFDIEESPLRDVQWLLTHIYFLCLKRLPALTKSWWMECKSRQTVVSIESWTEKYISPPLIADALDTVSEWANTQDSTSDDAVIVKTSQRAKEITVSKEIDDQVMSMVIRLPNNFPLGDSVLTGINRVAVDEKKWRSWLLNSQGVIKFSNNSLIDGIIAFRRNVVGALKGQTECAICYAIVGSDKQLPTKKCGTCNNLFHGSCLYRWFKSSNSSSCPLCRNPFNYT